MPQILSAMPNIWTCLAPISSRTISLHAMCKIGVQSTGQRCTSFKTVLCMTTTTHGFPLLCATTGCVRQIFLFVCLFIFFFPKPKRKIFCIFFFLIFLFVLARKRCRWPFFFLIYQPSNNDIITSYHSHDSSDEFEHLAPFACRSKPFVPFVV